MTLFYFRLNNSGTIHPIHFRFFALCRESRDNKRVKKLGRYTHHVPHYSTNKNRSSFRPPWLTVVKMIHTSHLYESIERKISHIPTVCSVEIGFSFRMATSQKLVTGFAVPAGPRPGHDKGRVDAPSRDLSNGTGPKSLRLMSGFFSWFP